jgi:hypothetical protein
MREYIFIYVDKKFNELKREKRECANIREAWMLASTLLANSSIKDLYHITVQKVYDNT